ncbi:glycosyltransferase family 39 protein [Aquicoccus sp. SCR17]|nr:glycosyltransferase family 39 protein [Carideicomes alvinocaridis]
MRNSAADQGGWLGWTLAWVGAITALRVLLLAFNRTDLFVDESQYWLWGQHFAFGYYSKPPLIGWLIGATTWVVGSDAPFAVRLPAPLLTGIAALLVAAVAARLFGARAGRLAGIGYATLPMAAISSLLIYPDTVMLPLLAGALLVYLRVLERPSRVGPALLCGLLLGLAFMAKYAAIYYLLCAPLAALLLPAARPAGRDVLAILGMALLVIAPNIWWNIVNGAPTLAHTMDNAEWVRDPGARAELEWLNLASFLVQQAAFVGPVVFGALAGAALRWRRQGEPGRLMLLFAWPIVALICLQALLNEAYVNWAAAAYLAGSALVFAALAGHPRWLSLSFVLNGAFCLVLPLATIWADTLSVDGRTRLLGRYTGQAEMSRTLIEAARQAGISTIVAGDRHLLADLFYTGRDSGLVFRSAPPPGRPMNHYQMSYPLTPADPSPALYATPVEGTPCPEAARPLGEIRPEAGIYRGRRFRLSLVPSDCWARQ